MRKLCFALLSLAFFSACLSAQTQTRPASALHKPPWPCPSTANYLSVSRPISDRRMVR